MEKIEEKYKEFLKVVPEKKRDLTMIDLHLIENQNNSIINRYRQEMLERKILDPEVQMPRHEFLSRMKEEELNAISDFIEDFHNSIGHKNYYSYAVMAVGSNIWGEESKKEMRKFFEKNNYSLDDSIQEAIVEWGGDAEEHQKGGRLTIRQILNNEHNDIDLLFCPDPVLAMPQYSERDSIRPYKEKFYNKMKERYNIIKEEGNQIGEEYMKNPQTNEIWRTKMMEYGEETLNCLDYRKNSRPIHAYFKDQYAESKIKLDLAERMPFSVLIRRGQLSDLHLAIWNGLGRGIFENPAYEHLLESKK